MNNNCYNVVTKREDLLGWLHWSVCGVVRRLPPRRCRTGRISSSGRKTTTSSTAAGAAPVARSTPPLPNRRRRRRGARPQRRPSSFRGDARRAGVPLLRPAPSRNPAPFRVQRWYPISAVPGGAVRRGPHSGCRSDRIYLEETKTVTPTTVATAVSTPARGITPPPPKMAPPVSDAPYALCE